MKVSLASSQIKKLALCFGGEIGKRNRLKPGRPSRHMRVRVSPEAPKGSGVATLLP